MSLKKFVDKTIHDFLGAGARLLLVAEYHKSKVVERQRLRKCRGSEKHGIPECSFYNKDRDQCKSCKCIVEVKAKTLTNYTLTGDVEITHCPQGFWEDKFVQEYYKKIKLEKIVSAIESES